MEPCEHWENAATKRRLFNLLVRSGLIDKLARIKAKAASREEITLVHTEAYHDMVVEMSARGGGDAGDMATFGPGGYEIAALSAGGVLAAVDAVVQGSIRNAYCLVRPPGHHAEPDKGMGFCIFNNIAIAAQYARTLTTKDGKPIRKVAIVDYDVHHGNGTQKAFWDDADCLFVSLHQDNNYPVGAGSATDIGGIGAVGANINIPLPPGSGIGAYGAAFEQIVLPALDAFRPDFILVSSGFDASFADPLASMMLSSEAFAGFARSLKDMADKHCNGRLVFAHEGGYSKDYVPFCGLAVIEAISGISSGVEDSYLEEVRAWNHQALQAHQLQAINTVCRIHGLPLRDHALSTAEMALREQVKEVLKDLPADRQAALIKSLL